MPRQNNGTYLQPANTAGGPPGAVISSSAYNTYQGDIDNEITNSLDRLGRGAMQAILNFGGFTGQNIANPVNLTDVVNKQYLIGQVQPATQIIGTTGGTADAITATFTPTITSLTAGMTLLVRATAANATTTPTFQADSTAAATIVKYANAALVAGDIPGAGFWMFLTWDATNSKWVLDNPFPPVAATPVNVPVRQVVLGGPVLTSGLPNFLPASAGALSLTIANVTANAPLTLTAANAFVSSGQNDVVFQTTSNSLTWSSLTANSTLYLWVNASTGATGFTSLVPIYQLGGTPATTNNQFTFNIGQMTGYMGNGSTAPQTPIVFVGECATGASTVTSTVAYAYQGYFDSGLTATLPAAGTQVTINHNLGTRPTARPVLYFQCTTTNANYAVGDFVTDVFTNSTPLNFVANRLTGGFTPNSASPWTLESKTTGNIISLTAADWSYGMVYSRGW
jgi:hypothetical protein